VRVFCRTAVVFFLFAATFGCGAEFGDSEAISFGPDAWDSVVGRDFLYFEMHVVDERETVSFSFRTHEMDSFSDVVFLDKDDYDGMFAVLMGAVPADGSVFVMTDARMDLGVDAALCEDYSVVPAFEFYDDVGDSPLLFKMPLGFSVFESVLVGSDGVSYCGFLLAWFDPDNVY